MYCQGLQTCLEPFLHEPRVLMHQLVPSKHAPCPPKQPEPENPSLNCWNFMQSATKAIDESEKVYVHPRSTSCLSTKSLEMCTESLGSETGSLIDSSVDEYSYKQSSGVIKEAKKRQVRKKLRHFPPPLTSISGSEGVQVQSHREGGRLLIKAFTYSCCSSYFQAERRDGRLRLSLLKDGGENDENVDDEGGEEGGDFWGENEERVDEDLKGGFWGEKEWSSSSRCNDDRSKRLPSLPFWVAIS